MNDETERNIYEEARNNVERKGLLKTLAITLLMGIGISTIYDIGRKTGTRTTAIGMIEHRDDVNRAIDDTYERRKDFK